MPSSDVVVNAPTSGAPAGPDDRSAALDPAPPRRGATLLERGALAGTLVPFMVAVVRASANDWMPTGDAALVVMRSRDVFTSHHPWGSFYLDLLAPWTKLSPYLGAAFGAALVNAVCIVLVWLVATRVVRPVVVVLVMAGTLVLVATLGLSWLIDSRPQFAMVLPLFALLWLSMGMWAGVDFAPPVAVVVASLCAQTHFTLAYQAVGVWIVGAAGYVIALRLREGGRERLRRTARLTGICAAVCWIQPFLAQFFVDDNLGSVFGPPGSGPGAGFASGIEVMANAAFVPPFWLPGSMGSFLGPDDTLRTASAFMIVAIWLAAAAATVSLGWRGGSAITRRAGASALVAVVAGVVAVVQIPSTAFGLAPENYYWLWSLGAFVTLALLAGLLSLPDTVSVLRGARAAVRWSVPAVGLLVTVGFASWPRYPLAHVANAEVEARRLGQPLRGELADAFGSAGVVDEAVEVNLGSALFSDFRYLVPLELQRAGVDFRVADGDATLGTSRCTPAAALPQVSFVTGRGSIIPEPWQVLAEEPGISDAELAEYDELSETFGDLLRDEVVSVDLAGVEWYFNPPLDHLTEVMSSPGTPANGLAVSLDTWREWKMVFTPPDLRPDFDRWVDLEQRISAGFVQVVLVPSDPAAERDHTC